MRDIYFRSPGEPGTFDQADQQWYDEADPRGLRGHVPWNGGSALRQGVARLDGILPTPGLDNPLSEPVSRRGEHAPGAGRADGGNLGTAGSRSRPLGPDFSRAVPPGGYTWWYLDGTSDDGRNAITIIAFIGSVFSPYYKALGRRAPRDHVAMNVAVYSPSRHYWTMTERRESALEQSKASIRVGPSWMSWDGKGLDVWVDEVGCPIPRRVRGRIRLSEGALTPQRFLIDRNGRHTWQPLATSARIEVELQHPQLKWSGSGYLDSNFGSEPLEDVFNYWNWSRATTSRGTVVQYDVETRSGGNRSLTVELDRNGVPHEIALPRLQPLPPTHLWRIARATRSDEHSETRITRTLEDTPFYSRSLIEGDVQGERTRTVHESLDLRRFAHPVVQFMLAHRMPRRWL